MGRQVLKFFFITPVNFRPMNNKMILKKIAFNSFFILAIFPSFFLFSSYGFEISKSQRVDQNVLNSLYGPTKQWAWHLDKQVDGEDLCVEIMSGADVLDRALLPVKADEANGIVVVGCFQSNNTGISLYIGCGNQVVHDGGFCVGPTMGMSIKDTSSNQNLTSKVRNEIGRLSYATMTSGSIATKELTIYISVLSKDNEKRLFENSVPNNQVPPN